MKVMQEYNIPIQYEVGEQLAISLPALFLSMLEVHHLLFSSYVLKMQLLHLTATHQNVTVH